MLILIILLVLFHQLWTMLLSLVPLNPAIRRSTHPSQSCNRFENLILFCLPEASLLASKSVSNHLICRSVEVLDAFHLGCKPNLPNAAADPST